MDPGAVAAAASSDDPQCCRRSRCILSGMCGENAVSRRLIDEGCVGIEEHAIVVGQRSKLSVFKLKMNSYTMPSLHSTDFFVASYATNLS